MPTGRAYFDQPSKLRIPPFWCPIPVAEYPAARELGERSAAWMTRLKVWVDREHGVELAASGIGRLVALTAPRGLPERIQIVSDLNVWYHAVDDAVGDGGRARRTLPDLARLAVQLTSVLAEPQAPTPHSDPFVRALHDICARLIRVAAREQYAEWAFGLQAYLMHEVSEQLRRQESATPTLQEYIDYCTDGRAALPSMLMLPIVGGYRVADDEMARLRAATRMACVIASWDNDIYSLPKEAGQRGHVSLPKLLALESDGDLQSALEASMALRDQVMARFLDERSRQEREVGPDGRRYLADLASWIRGQLEWGLSSRRFATPNAAMPATWGIAPRAPRREAAGCRESTRHRRGNRVITRSKA